jgi:hypothetical protein
VQVAVVGLDDVVGQRGQRQRRPADVDPGLQVRELGGHDVGGNPRLDTGDGQRAVAVAAVVQPEPVEDAGGAGVLGNDLGQRVVVHLTDGKNANGAGPGTKVPRVR